MRKVLRGLVPSVLNFVYFMAFYIITWIAVYFWKLTFTPAELVNNQQASEIKTAYIGWGAAIVGYLFGVMHGAAMKKDKKEDETTPQ